jgi:hypothetical protein
MLRHTLATLAYRAAKVLRDAPPGFAAFAAADGSRTAGQIVAHLGDLMDWATSIVDRDQSFTESVPQEWDADVRRFFDALTRFDAAVARADAASLPLDRLFQGPVADALGHVGQLAMLRRLAGAPIRAENFFAADITEGRVGPEQTPPSREF